MKNETYGDGCTQANAEMDEGPSYATNWRMIHVWTTKEGVPKEECVFGYEIVDRNVNK